MTPDDLRRFGYTAGCPGCVRVQSGAGNTRNYNETCRARIDEKLPETTAGLARTELEANRREAELVRELQMEYTRIQREKAPEDTGIAVQGEGSVPKPSRAD